MFLFFFKPLITKEKTGVFDIYLNEFVEKQTQILFS